MHSFNNFWYFLHRHFIINHDLFTSEQDPSFDIPYLSDCSRDILSDRSASVVEISFMWWSFVSWTVSRCNSPHGAGRPCLQSWASSHDEGLFSTHCYQRAQSVIGVGALSRLCIWNKRGSFSLDMKSAFHGTQINDDKLSSKLVTYLKVAVAAVWPELQSAAAAESAAFPVLGTTRETRITTTAILKVYMFQTPSF